MYHLRKRIAIVGCCMCAFMASAQAGGISYFGYVGVDCWVSDPIVQSGITNYISEASTFTNVAHMCVNAPTDNISSRAASFTALNVRAFVSVHSLFFVSVAGSSPASPTSKLVLRSDYRARWSSFVIGNRSSLTASSIAALYIADEPTWNGISYTSLKTVSDLVKSTFPAIPVAIVEAPLAVSSLRVPASIDWIGFDRYGTPDPSTDTTYLSEFAQLKSKRSRADQKLITVMEGQWYPSYGDAGYPQEAMAQVAQNYYKQASSDPDVIAILVYSWPGGIDGPTQYGTRDLPSTVLDQHRIIGNAITGKVGGARQGH